MMCDNDKNTFRGSAISPLKTLQAIESYCAMLSPPPCLYGMPEVNTVLESLHAFCDRKVLASSTPDQYRYILLLATRDILEPVLVILWCQLAINKEVSLGQMPGDFNMRMRELDNYLPSSMVDNMWHLIRAGEEASNQILAGPWQLEILLVVLHRLKQLFDDVNDVVSTGGRLRAIVSLDPVYLPDFYKIPSPPHSDDNIATASKHYGDNEPANRSYSLFGGFNTWSFGNDTLNSLPSTLPPTTLPSSYNKKDPVSYKLNKGNVIHNPHHHANHHAVGDQHRVSLISGSTSLPSMTGFINSSEPTSPLYDGPHTPTSPTHSHSDRHRHITMDANGPMGMGGMGPDSVIGEPLHRPMSGSYNMKQDDVVAVMANLDLGSPSGGDGSDWQEPPVRYKTAMCKRVIDGQKCRYSKACGFAHGEVERDHYTSLHLATIRCTFGIKCHNPSCGRAHTTQEQRLAVNIYNQAVDRSRGGPLKP